MASIENVLSKMNALPNSKKTAILAILVVCIAGMMLLITWINKDDYQVLYSNLSEEDAGRIVQELKEKKVSYKLEGPNIVLVPSEEVYDLRLQLASSGIPQGGGIGFEIFDNTSFTTSEFVQKLNYRRALEGELTRTIRSLNGVQQCRVHLVIPEKSIFALQEEAARATAAVFVSLEQGRRLSRNEVEGIVHLVSSSVQDLRSEDITVVDNKGVLLTRPSGDSMIGLSNTQMEYQQNYEKSVVNKIMSILEPVVGIGKVQAKVSAAFDFTRSERTEEIFDPEGVVVRSEQKSTEKTISGGGTGGIPGTASNLPGGGGANRTSSMGQSQKQDEMINYETSKTVRRVVESPISLEKLSVAIVIDGMLESQAETVENPDEYVTRSEADISYYEEIVRKTIGYTEDRGDEITVTVMPFRNMEMGKMEEVEKDYMPVVYRVLKYLVIIIVTVLLFLFVVKPLINMITKVPSEAERGTSVTVRDAEQEEPLQPRQIPVEKQVIDWAQQNPKQAAGVVKGWLEEE